jgi:hypothetical protein
MLRAQKLVPKLPARVQRALVWLAGRRRFVHWSFRHYLEIAPPEAAPPAPAPRSDPARLPAAA